MKIIFDDEQFSFQLLRVLGDAVNGAADIGECLSTANRIKEGDFESWHDEWLKTARRIHAVADANLAAGHRVSACEAYRRASNYYRAAEFYLHGDPTDPRITKLSGASAECFRRGIQLQVPPVEMVEVPYDGTTLPAHFYRVDESEAPRPTLILHSGFDGTIEELHGTAMAAARRGINCLTFEGPGQGRVIREQGLPFRPDWEHVVTSVVDHVQTLPGVDPTKIALMGLSMGGYLAPRAAAFEHRLVACVANGGIFDFSANQVPPGMSSAELLGFIRQDAAAADKEIWKAAEANTEVRWGIQNGMFTFKAATPSEYLLKASEFELTGVAEQITCPTLVVDAEAEHSFAGEAKKLYDALRCPKEFMLFTAEEGAEEHCQIGAAMISQERIFGWLEDVLDERTKA
ncbi:MAG: alpha/beta fold hydrolase [Halobacteriota archaeon]|jgi:alpha-beta hydrolase superfamily lysophospholipase